MKVTDMTDAEALKELERWASLAVAATKADNELILELRSRGLSFQRIADHAGLSRSGVLLICKGASNE